MKTFNYLLISLVLLLTATVNAEELSYLNENGELTKLTDASTSVTSSLTSWSDGWYVVDENVTISDRIQVSGTVNLLLKNGVTLTAEKGINVESGTSFNVYAQSDKVSEMGSLNATGDLAAGIGGESGGIITINGGTVNATGDHAAGIGGGSGGIITINGGTVTAMGGIDGAGIGGGFGGSGGTITINGGTVSATGGGPGAGIGGGFGGSGGTITINGGTVSATGGGSGAGIGGGLGGSGGIITINGGTVTAMGGNNGAGIGCGEGAGGGTINIIGGKVTANGGRNSVGIGSGRGGGGNIIFGWTNADDFVYASSYGNFETIKFAGGKRFYYEENGEITIVEGLENAGGKILRPIYNKNSMTFATISGILPYYFYTGDKIALTYKVTDIEGKELVAETDYTVSLDKSPIKDMGDYTLTIAAKDGGVYTGSKTVSFTVGDGIPVTATTTAMTNGIYRVSSDVTVDERIVITGDVTLFLDDGKTLTASKGLNVSSGNKLTIDGKGSLNATGQENAAGIGGGFGESGGTITINGGTVSATGVGSGAGIGGGYEGAGGTITINGGTVIATGGFSGAGIGGGVNGAGGSINITGGKVTANGGYYSVGIGGGLNGAGGSINITGGKVTANGGYYSVGIGGGYNGSGGNITFGWTNEDDFIYADSYGDVESFKFADGKSFYYEELGKNVIVVSADNIGGMTLRPLYDGKNSLKYANISGVLPYYNYTGEDIALLYKVTDVEGKELAIETDYSAIFIPSSVKDEGDYTLTIKAKDGGIYAGSKSVSFSVVKFNLENAVVGGVNPYYLYTGEEIALTYKVTDSEGKELVAGTDYTTTFTPSPVKDVGDYTLTIAAKDGSIYTGSKKFEFSIVSIKGCGSEADPYIISNEKEWNYFAVSVNNGETYSGKFIKLEADISVSTKVGVRNGSQNRAFSGVFDGGGHTITANITDKDNSGTALFGYISGATIKKLTLTGKITGGIHAAGIVGSSAGTGNKIDSCVVSATIDGGSHIGGILGHGLDSDIDIDNCVFKGTLVGGGTAKGVLFGWGDEGGTKSVRNCLYIQQSDQNTDNLDLAKMSAGSVTVADCYKTANVGNYGELVYLTSPADAFVDEKIATDGTKFYSILLDRNENGYYVNMPVTGSRTIIFPSNEKCFYVYDDGGKNANYSNNASGTLQLVAPKDYSFSVSLKAFDTEYDRDKLTIYDGNNNSHKFMTSRSGSIESAEYFSTGNSIKFYFKSNSSVNNTGFVFEVCFEKGALSGSGSKIDPYIIGNNHDWKIFSNRVANGNSYAGQFIKLNADIVASKKIGNSDKGLSFSGVFDGNGHTITASISDEGNGTALFNSINGAKIENLIVAGNVNGGLHAAGLVGYSTGSGNKIEKCVVTATISGSSHIGGILGHGTSSDIAIDDCVFKGKLVGGSFAKGVFFGWGDEGGEKIVSNSLYIPPSDQDFANLDLAKMNAGSVNVMDCHKTVDVGIYGSRAYLNNPANILTIKKTAADGTVFYATAGSSINNPLVISNVDDWNAFANSVNAGNTYKGQFVKLLADISVSQKVGDYTKGKAFSGIFDGNGHTITANISEENNWGAALFGYINGASIKNLTLEGRITGGIHTAGIVGFSMGLGNKIEKCVVDAVINGGSHIGGILGHGTSSDIVIDDCVFKGVLNGGLTAIGVFFGWGDAGGTKSVTNCLYIQLVDQNTSMLNLARMDAGRVNLVNCYKTKKVGSYGTLVSLWPTSNIVVEKSAVDGTKFYITLGSLQGNGSSTKPYIINSESDWQTFVTAVNEGYSFAGEFVKLAANITVSQKAGDYEHGRAFSGTFDGDGHTITASITDEVNSGTALFGFIKWATIKNLSVAGTIDGALHAAGLVGYSQGKSNRIEKCVVSAEISGNMYVGGILGNALNSDIVIDDCVFKGLVYATSGSKGVFVGDSYKGGKKSVSNSLYISDGRQIYLNFNLTKWTEGDESSVSLIDCYRNVSWGETSEGTRVYLESEAAPVGASLVEKVAADGTKFYIRALLGDGSSENPYIIHSAYDWDLFASAVNDGNSYVGKFVKLDANISVSTSAGNYAKGCAFSGTFDGGGNIVTVKIDDAKKPGTALFGYINGATVKNITMVGTISGGMHAAGLVGYSYGKGNRIEKCVVSATISGGTHVGGILGHGLDSDIAIEGCVFRGVLVGGKSAKGVFFGWGDKGGSKSVTNSLYVFQNGQNTDHLDLAQMDGGNVFMNDCYKTVAVGTYGSLAFLSTNAVTTRKIAADGTRFYVCKGSSIDNPFVVKNEDDWDIFAKAVNNGNSYRGEFIKLVADISVSQKVGDYNKGKAFSGLFDGNGHTITANISEENNRGTALFGYINGATIKNLSLNGFITGENYTAGIVGYSNGFDNKIERCVVAATINGGSHIGGILGHGLSSDVVIDDCVFKGVLKPASSSKGAFIGESDYGGNKKILNSLYISHGEQDYFNFNLAKWTKNDNTSVSITDCYRTVDFYEAEGSLVYLDEASVPAGMIPIEKTAAGNTKFYIAAEALYSVTLPEHFDLVSVSNTAGSLGKYITGTTVSFRVNGLYKALNVSDGKNILTPTDGVYKVTVGDADILVTAELQYDGDGKVDLAKVGENFVASDGDVLVGVTNHSVSIPDGANVTISDAMINGGIVCEGSATITLAGMNYVVGSDDKAGIHVGGEGTTLTVKGTGTLIAKGGAYAAGIGLNSSIVNDEKGGNIVFEGGTVTAVGGNGASGIGKGTVGNGLIASLGSITIYTAVDKVEASSISEYVFYKRTVSGSSGSSGGGDIHIIIYVPDEDDDGHGESESIKRNYFVVGELGERRIIIPKDKVVDEYSINVVENIEHGSLLAYKNKKVKVYDKVTVYGNPDEGYKMKKLNVRDAQGYKVEVNNSENGFTFQMPTSDVTMSATFARIYKVDIDPGIKNGLVRVVTSKPFAGQRVELEIKPADGFSLCELNVRTVYGESVSVSNGGFVMPSEDVVVSALFLPGKKIVYLGQVIRSHIAEDGDILTGKTNYTVYINGGVVTLWNATIKGGIQKRCSRDDVWATIFLAGTNRVTTDEWTLGQGHTGISIQSYRNGADRTGLVIKGDGSLDVVGNKASGIGVGTTTGCQGGGDLVIESGTVTATGTVAIGEDVASVPSVAAGIETGCEAHDYYYEGEHTLRYAPGIPAENNSCDVELGDVFIKGGVVKANGSFGIGVGANSVGSKIGNVKFYYGLSEVEASINDNIIYMYGETDVTKYKDIFFNIIEVGDKLKITSKDLHKNTFSGVIPTTLTIPHGGTVTLDNTTINGGIVCEGDATITLVGKNYVTGAADRAGIRVGPEYAMLTIRGEGSLDVQGGGSYAAAIGLDAVVSDENQKISGGSITIEGGNITTRGNGPGIGMPIIAKSNPVKTVEMGNIYIKGGSIKAGDDGKSTIGMNYSGKDNIKEKMWSIMLYHGFKSIDADINPYNDYLYYYYGDERVDDNVNDYFKCERSCDDKIYSLFNIGIDNNIANGTIAATVASSNGKAYADEVVTLSAMPKSGYKVDFYTVKDTAGNNVEVNGNTFVMPLGNVTVSAKFVSDHPLIMFSEDGKKVTIEGEYDGKDIFNIDKDITVDEVVFNREFTPNSGFATIMLPFDINATKLTGVKSIIEFAGVFDNNGKNAVGMKYVWCNADLGKEVEDKGYTNCNELSGDLTAYTPYMVEMESATLGINGGVTLKPNSGASAGDARKDDWVFRGALQKKEWSGDENIIKNGRIWAFAGSERNGATIGQFRRIGGNTSVKPFRAYLVDCAGVPEGSDCEEYFENQSEPSYVSRYRFADVLAPANSAENSLSAEKQAGTATNQPLVMRVSAANETASLNGMEIVIVDGDKDSIGGNEHTTVIGRVNPATGEIHMRPRTKQTYDLKGRKVGKGKKAKGAYYRK
jgi:hypothetical protein